MKKEKLFAVSIALLMLFGVMSCSNEGSSNSEKESTPSTSEKLSIAHDVMVRGGEGAYVQVTKPSALEGEAVQVIVAMTDPSYVLREVRLGEQVLNAQVDPENAKVTTYGFLMPDEDVEVMVHTFVPTKEHLIHFEENGLVSAIGLAKDGDTGDVVSFKLRLVSGYALESVKVYSLGTGTEGEDVEIDVYSEISGEYYFEMPNSDVKIVTEARGAFFQLSVDAKDAIMETSFQNQWKSCDFVDAFYDENGDYQSVSSSSTSALYRAGEIGHFRGKRPGQNSDYSWSTKADCYATHYYVDGIEVFESEESSEDSYGTVYYDFEFVMPNKDAQITVVAEEREISVKLDLPEQMEGRMYRYNENQEEVEVKEEDKFRIGERIYYTAKLKDDVSEEDYRIISTYANIPIYTSNNVATSRIDTTWSRKIDWPSGSNSSSIHSLEGSEGVMYFDIPSLYYVDHVISIQFGLKDNNLLKDSPVVGTWYGFEFWRFSKYGSSLLSVEVNTAGEMISSTSSLKGEVMEVHEEENYYLANCNNVNKKFYMYGSSAVISYSSSDDTPTDCYFFVKDDSLSMSSVISYRIYSTDSECVIAAYNEEGKLLGTLFLRKETASLAAIMVPGVTITMNTGDFVDEDGATFTVEREGISYLTVE